VKQGTQYNCNKKQTYNVILSHRQLEDKPIIQRLENTTEWEDEG